MGNGTNLKEPGGNRQQDDLSDSKLDSMHQDGRDPFADSPQLGLDSDEVNEMGGDNERIDVKKKEN
ncbi:hypothetical protein Pedsa_1252 [Pseudopedobacter saltans DSM 12145]|uniref:Uncharacterized protein n=1 Tax=Pseudopedobacter saltans (strain ATCC 51119 / DSM 12145 / JCM 21818 / CCUG 39354 / LMG 10337 / NBRC 100064 / NCIMB 13643) TaxID=762903 RepID=F0SDS4_PSESL|nr:hypothetical protein [Pseudopedobacter saltans]ADY51820.1 hypothetical protein Pedsa_1252 [Pseudopedobacter saltans DSM 12145]